MLTDSGFGIYTDISQNVRKVEILRFVLPFITQRYIDQWTADINRQNAPTGTGGNKLRFNRTFKADFNVESYCKTVFKRACRGASQNFGVALPRLQSKLGAIMTEHVSPAEMKSKIKRMFYCTAPSLIPPR